MQHRNPVTAFKSSSQVVIKIQPDYLGTQTNHGMGHLDDPLQSFLLLYGPADTLHQDTLHCAPVKVHQRIPWQLQLPQKVEALLCLFDDSGGVNGPGEVLNDVSESSGI